MSDRSMELAKEEPFRLGHIAVDPSTCELVIEDQHFQLEPKVMQVLVVLSQSPGRVVSRTRLFDTCWQGRFVGEESLNRCIGILRKIANNALNIRTIPKVGYRLELPTATNEAADDTIPATSIQGPGAFFLEKGENASSVGGYRPIIVMSVRMTARRSPLVEVQSTDWHSASRWLSSAIEQVTRSFDAHLLVKTARSADIVFGYPANSDNLAFTSVRAGHELLELTATLGTQGYRAGAFDINIGLHLDYGPTPQQPDDLAWMLGEPLQLSALAARHNRGSALYVTSPLHELVADKVSSTLLHSGEMSSDWQADQALFRIEDLRALERKSQQGLSNRPFVGRKAELGALHDAWLSAADGIAQKIFVCGEAGIGKSRLVSEFLSNVTPPPSRLIICKGDQWSKSTPLLTVRVAMEQALGIGRAMDLHARRQKIADELSSANLWSQERFTLMTEFLGASIADDQPVTMGPSEHRAALLDALTCWFLSSDEDGVRLLACEDVQWLDSTSLELVQMVWEAGSDQRVMILCTARDDYGPSPDLFQDFTVVPLSALTSYESHELILQLTREPHSADDLKDKACRSDGNPLFIEQLARTRSDETLPLTVFTALSARLDRLGDLRDTALIAAALGEHIKPDWLAHVCSSAGDDALRQLVEREIIVALDDAGERVYRFRHSLMRETAYKMLAPDERHRVHDEIARLIVETVKTGERSAVEQLAWHCIGAGRPLDAIEAWVELATQAKGTQAYREAEAAFRQALNIAKDTADIDNRDALEFRLLSGLRAMVQLTSGEGAHEAVALSDRRLALIRKVGRSDDLIEALLQNCSQAMVAGNYREASILSRQIVELAEQNGTPKHRARACQSEFLTRYLQGDFDGAEAFFREWEVLRRAGLGGADYRVRDAYCYGALRAWVIAENDLSHERIEFAQAYAERSGEQFEIAGVWVYKALLKVFEREPEAATAAARAALAISEPLDLKPLSAMARILHGHSLVRMGKDSAGLQLMRQNISNLKSLDYRMAMPGFLTILAEAELLSDQTEAALLSSEEALRFNKEEKAYRAYALSTHGDILQALGEEEKARESYQEAISLAHSTGATAYELRAANSYAKMLLSNGELQNAEGAIKRPLDALIGRTPSFDMKISRQLLASMQNHPM